MFDTLDCSHDRGVSDGSPATYAVGGAVLGTETRAMPVSWLRRRCESVWWVVLPES